MKLAYFVHDIADPAVTRRVRMLKAGGAAPVVLGFRRSEQSPGDIEGCPTIDLGRTYDAQLRHRAKRTALAALGAWRLRRLLAGADVVMARTLEMLAVAEAARLTCGLRATLVYECLDVHRLLLEDTVVGSALRSTERALMRRASLLVVSSPAFLEAYFRPVHGLDAALRIPSLLVENKLLQLGGELARPPTPPPGPPWRIGWMGAIRCRKSLDRLIDVAKRRPDLVEVRIHGRPAHSELGDFEGRIAPLANVSFGGAYAAADLPRLYGEVHFSWAIDFMEEGRNSSWLLPNRIYEGSRFGAPPLALADVQTGRFLAERGFGVRLRAVSELEPFLASLTPARYAALRARLEALPDATFTAREADCRRLVESLPSRFRHRVEKDCARSEQNPGDAVVPGPKPRSFPDA